MKKTGRDRLILAVLFAFAPLLSRADDGVEKQVAKDRATWDEAKISGDQTPVTTTGAQAPAAPAPSFPAVDDSTLKKANDDVLALRQKVWAGQLPPDQFYPQIQQAYAQRFGPDYAAKVKAFLDAKAAAAPRSAQTVDFSAMSPQQREAFFKDMPKGAELHLHVTGGIPPEKILEIGEQLGTELPAANIEAVLRVKDLSAYGVDPAKAQFTVGELPAKLRADLASALVTHDGENFSQFLDKWKIIGPITTNDASYYPMMKYMADYAKSQNIVYLELLVSGIPAVQQAAADAAKRVQTETGVTIRLIASNGWYSTKQQDQDAIAKAEALSSQGVVGFNMVADERLPPLNHYDAFAPLRDKLSKLSVSLHAGEQAGTATNIVNDLLLNVKRYGHATHVEENPIAEALLYENKTPVEVSLISNEKTLVMPDLSGHPEPKFLAWGVPVIPDTDDPGVFGSTLSREYRTAQSQFNLSWDQLKEMSRNGIRYSFADAATKARLMRDLDKRIRAFEHSPEFKQFHVKPGHPVRPRKSSST